MMSVTGTLRCVSRRGVACRDSGCNGWHHESDEREMPCFALLSDFVTGNVHSGDGRMCDSNRRGAQDCEAGVACVSMQQTSGSLALGPRTPEMHRGACSGCLQYPKSKTRGLGVGCSDAEVIDGMARVSWGGLRRRGMLQALLWC